MGSPGRICSLGRTGSRTPSASPKSLSAAPGGTKPAATRTPLKARTPPASSARCRV